MISATRDVPYLDDEDFVTHPRVDQTEDLLRSGESIRQASIATGLTEHVVGLISDRIGGHAPRTIPRPPRSRRSRPQLAAFRAWLDATRPVKKGGAVA